MAITGRSASGLTATGEMLGDVVLLHNDAGDIGQQPILAAQLAKSWPRLDILYINAGDVTHLPLQEWDEQRYDQLMNTNLKGPLF